MNSGSGGFRTISQHSYIFDQSIRFKGEGTVPCGAAVHAAAVTFDLTERGSPAVVTVTVPVAVTHLTDGQTG